MDGPNQILRYNFYFFTSHFSIFPLHLHRIIVGIIRLVLKLLRKISVGGAQRVANENKIH